MDKIDIILWVLSGGFGLMLVMWHFLNSHMERQDKKIDGIEKDLQQLNTKVAVIESKITDISSNVSHLMWHHQSLPQKEAEEQ